MKKIELLFTIFMLASISDVNAYDFSNISPSGHMLYYNINSDGLTVTVTYPGSSEFTLWDGYTKPMGNLVIPSSVTYLGNTYIVSTINDHAFYGCFDLTSVTMGSDVTIIGSQAFQNCSSLDTITLPEGLTTMNSCVFYGCCSLNSIIIPNTCNSIGYAAFEGCSSLTSINIPEGVISIGGYAFQGCSSIEYVTIPDNVTQIGAWAFSYCTSLSHAIIGNSVTTIGIDAFRDCGSLNDITIGRSVTSIGNSAFLNCNNLTKITTLAEVAPLISSGVFSGVSASTEIYVPCGSTTSYSSNWTMFSNFIDFFPFRITISSSDSTMGDVRIIDSASCQSSVSVVSAEAICGYYFSHWSDGSNENPRLLTIISDTNIIAYFNRAIDTIYIHDTAYIDTYIHDTTYIHLPYAIHDTTYIYVHDTTYLNVLVHDTTYINVPYPVHDTTYVPYPVHDTTYVNVPYPVHDTIYINLPYPVHDTTYVNVPYPVHDTSIVTDTIWLTQYDTVWLHDTIIVHDTIYITQEDIDRSVAVNVKVYANHGQIVVEGAMGNTVTMYDVNGRMLATRQDNNTPMRFDAPVNGTYMIKIGNYPARKVVVIR